MPGLLGVDIRLWRGISNTNSEELHQAGKDHQDLYHPLAWGPSLRSPWSIVHYGQRTGSREIQSMVNVGVCVGQSQSTFYQNCLEQCCPSVRASGIEEIRYDKPQSKQISSNLQNCHS